MNRNPLIISVLLLGLLAACTTQLPTPQGRINATLEQGTYYEQTAFDPDAAITAETFGSVQELSAFLAAHQGGGNYYYDGGLTRGLAIDSVSMDDMAMESAPAPTAAKQAAGDGGSLDYSETNNQVAGVDEGDIIKTDGDYIYTTSGDTLFIVKAYPAEDAAVLSKLALPKGPATGLFISGDTLAVFGMVSNNDVYAKLDYQPASSMTYVEVYDVADREAPRLVKDYLFEGYYQESRMIDSYAYIVTQSYPYYSPRLLPIYFEDGVQKEVAISTIRYFPIPYDSVQYAHVNAIDLQRLKTESLTLAVESGVQLYMSEDNLYLSTTKYINEWQIQQDVTVRLVTPTLPKEDKELIAKIKLVDDDVLNQAEKKNKIYEVISRHVQYLPQDEQEDLQDEIEAAVKEEMDSYDYYEYTVINKVSVKGLDIEATANGQAPGYLNNQFSMDEQDGVLRLATTVNQRWSSYGKGMTESENIVTTLDEDLRELDMLDGIAKGEQIYSARFMGERLYLVTFRQTDPFFVIDLSSPKNIKMLGELKVPGFSRYLHPYDENIIIGLGRDATETGRTKGLKISLFDVSDVSKPKEIASWVGDERYAQSTAEYEHKAFLFSKDKSLLVIPAYSYEWSQGGREGYNGAFVFKVTEDSIELRGLIDHAKGAQYDWGAAVERSLYIEDELYTKSYGLLRINALDDLHGIKDVTLEQTKGKGNIPVY